MLHKIFHALSPVWQLLFATLSIAIIANMFTAVSSTTNGLTIDFTRFNSDLNLLLVGLLGVVGWLAHRQIVRYNNESGANLSLWTLSPPELLETDERTKAVSAKATRAVYVYSNYALPILIVAILFVHNSLLLISIAVVIYLVGYYGTYLRDIWPLLDEA